MDKPNPPYRCIPIAIGETFEGEHFRQCRAGWIGGLCDVIDCGASSYLWDVSPIQSDSSHGGGMIFAADPDIVTDMIGLEIVGEIDRERRRLRRRTGRGECGIQRPSSRDQILLLDVRGIGIDRAQSIPCYR
jgi:hypothetical protein